MHFYDKINPDKEDVKENEESKNSFQTNNDIRHDQSKREGQKFAIYGGQKTGHGQQSSPYEYSESSLKVHSSVKDDEHYENEYNTDEYNTDKTDEYKTDAYDDEEYSDDYNDEDYSENDDEHHDDDEHADDDDDYNNVNDTDRKLLETKTSKRNKDPIKPRRKISKR